MEEKELGYRIKEYKEPVKRYCQTLDLKDNPELIEDYKKHHSKEYIWPEIPDGIKEVGILEMEIYLLGTRLFMIVETPLSFDWGTAMARLNTLPRQKLWEEFTSSFQVASPGASSSEKWQLMERIFNL
jgi:Uncharacterized conserved protein